MLSQVPCYPFHTSSSLQLYLRSTINLKNKTKPRGKVILYNGLKKYAYIWKKEYIYIYISLYSQYFVSVLSDFQMYFFLTYQDFHFYCTEGIALSSSGAFSVFILLLSFLGQPQNLSQVSLLLRRSFDPSNLFSPGDNKLFFHSFSSFLVEGR